LLAGVIFAAFLLIILVADLTALFFLEISIAIQQYGPEIRREFKAFFFLG
jgi:hypothetical protein